MNWHNMHWDKLKSMIKRFLWILKRKDFRNDYLMSNYHKKNMNWIIYLKNLKTVNINHNISWKTKFDDKN